MTDACVAADQWFARRGWQPFAFQREVWAAMAAGRSGLLHATTGSGKTYAVWMGALARRQLELRLAQPAALQVLWLTPMRALAADTQRALELPLPEMAPRWTRGPAHRRHLGQRARAAGSPAAHARW